MKETVYINKRIIEKCLAGDVKAQYQLYKQYSAAMYNIAIRFLNNKMDAEDVLQESFVKAFRQLGELKDTAAFGGWIKRIVTNNCISQLRKKRIRFEDIDDYKMDEKFEEDEEFNQETDPALVHEAIKNLPDGARTIIILRALEGHSHKEIAEILGISLSTSKTQFHRAICLLRKKLNHQTYAE